MCKPRYHQLARSQPSVRPKVLPEMILTRWSGKWPGGTGEAPWAFWTLAYLPARDWASSFKTATLIR